MKELCWNLAPWSRARLLVLFQQRCNMEAAALLLFQEVDLKTPHITTVPSTELEI